jgi:hypothetical protein
MRKELLLFVFLYGIIFIILYGCKESPTENTYYVTAIDSLSNPSTMPRVIFTNPANGAIGPFGNTDPTLYSSNPQITIQFNKLINIKNIAGNAITLKADSSYNYLRLSDGYNDIFNNILVFNSDSRYLAAKTYILTIDTTLTDIHGYKLSKPQIVSFIPEPKFRVYSVSPLLDGVEPLSHSQISLSFNSKVDKTIFSNISITPAIKGDWSMGEYYYSSDSLYIYYDLADTLAYNKKYTISVSSNAKDHNGLQIDKPYQFSFITSPFNVRLSSYSSSNGPGGFSVPNNFSFNFNAIVDTSTLRKSISVSPQISYNLSYSYGSNSNYIYINFKAEEFQRNTKYTIYFSSTIKSKGGDYLEPYSYSFTTGK